MNETTMVTGINVTDLMNRIESIIEQAIERKAQASQLKEAKQILTRKEVAAMLGGVSNPILTEWSKTGYLPSFKLGVRKVRYRLDVVQDFINNRLKAAA